MSDVKRFKLGGKFASFTGVLNNIYEIKDGVFTIGTDKRDPKVLIEHYGAVRVISKEEAEAQAKAAADALAALKAEEEREEAAKAAAAKSATAEDEATRKATGADAGAGSATPPASTNW